MQSTSKNLGHAKHRQAFGKNPVSSRQKLIRELEANSKKKPTRERELFDSVAEALKRKK